MNLGEARELPPLVRFRNPSLLRRAVQICGKSCLFIKKAAIAVARFSVQAGCLFCC
jgi:hypothetical protein